MTLLQLPARPKARPRPHGTVLEAGPEGDARSWRRWGRQVARRLRQDADAGMATAEYAIATVAAAGFAGLLIAILRSPEVKGLLLGIVRGALTV